MVTWQGIEISVDGIREARDTVYKHLRPTPLMEYPLLSALVGAAVHVKHENHNPTGSFKIRGGVNLMSRLDADQLERGVITATRGNHGQSVALASRLYGTHCLVAVPEGNNPEKNEAMEAFGAELLIHGKDFDEARERVEELQTARGMRYIHSGNEPHLIHGVGTYALEILEDLPQPDVIFVPLGGGSGLCGTLTAVRALSPATRVIGVQAAKANAFYLSWKAGHPVATDSADTMADGLATRMPFGLTFEIIKDQVDEIVTVTEDEIQNAIFELYRTTHNIAEGAGAAATAAALRMRAQLSGKQVVVVLSGCNIEAARLASILECYGHSGATVLTPNDPAFRRGG